MPRRELTHEPSEVEESSADEPIRLVIVESRELLGIGIREVLDREPDFEIVALVGSPDEAISVIDAAAPDVVLVDVPAEADAADAVRRMHQGAPDSPMVVLGGEDDDASILDAMDVGAAAHVAEVAEPAELVATIRRVAEGEDPLKDELISRPDLVERIDAWGRRRDLHAWSNASTLDRWPGRRPHRLQRYRIPGKLSVP